MLFWGVFVIQDGGPGTMAGVTDHSENALAIQDGGPATNAG